MPAKRGRMRRGGSWMAGLSLLMVLAGSGAADVVVMRGGNEVQGQILSKDDELVNVELLAGGLVSIYSQWIQEEKREDLVSYIIKRGDHYLHQGNRQRAFAEYLNAQTLAPNSPEVRERLNMVGELERLERCRQALEESHRLLSERKYLEAIQKIEERLDEAPPQLKRDMLRQLSETYATAAFNAYDHADLNKARGFLARAEELNPDSPMLHFVQGRLQQDQRKWREARQHYIKAIQGHPNLPRLREYLEQVDEKLLQEGR